MGKNKKKKMREVDIDAIEQKKLLDELNKCIDAGVLPASDDSLYESEDDSSMFDYVQAAFAERQAERNSEIDYSDYPDVTVANDDEDSDDECDNQNEILNHITFERIKGTEFKIIRISDGIRSIDIDINTINEDEEQTEYENIFESAKSFLSYIIRNFYPSAIISPSFVTETFEHVASVDDEKYYFFDYPYGDGPIILGYYIPDDVRESYEKIIEELVDCNKAMSFLTSVLALTDTSGFSFGHMNPTYVNQMMLLSRINESTSNFIKTIVFDDTTEFNEDVCNDNIYDAVPVYQFIDYDQFVSTEEEATESELSEEVDNIENEVPVTVEDALAESEDNTDEDDDDSTDDFFGDENDEEYVDPDEMEEMYFGKKNKQVDTFKSYNKKQNNNNDAPKNMIVERHV